MTKNELIKKIAELKEEKKKLSNLANVQDLRQYAFKIFLNSSYRSFRLNILSMF